MSNACPQSGPCTDEQNTACSMFSAAQAAGSCSCCRSSQAASRRNPCQSSQIEILFEQAWDEVMVACSQEKNGQEQHHDTGHTNPGDESRDRLVWVRQCPEPHLPGKRGKRPDRCKNHQMLRAWHGDPGQEGEDQEQLKRGGP